MEFIRLRELREKKDLYQKDIALMLKIKQQYYSEYESGKRTIPIERLIPLAQFYETSIDYIVGITDIKEPYPRTKKRGL